MSWSQYYTNLPQPYYPQNITNNQNVNLPPPYYPYNFVSTYQYNSQNEQINSQNNDQFINCKCITINFIILVSLIIPICDIIMGVLYHNHVFCESTINLQTWFITNGVIIICSIVSIIVYQNFKHMLQSEIKTFVKLLIYLLLFSLLGWFIFEIVMLVRDYTDSCVSFSDYVRIMLLLTLTCDPIYFLIMVILMVIKG